MELPQLTIDLQNLSLEPLLKIAILIMIIIYSVFTFFVYNKVNALNKIVFFPPRSAAYSIKTFAFFYFLLILSLFFLALVIV